MLSVRPCDVAFPLPVVEVLERFPSMPLDDFAIEVFDDFVENPLDARVACLQLFPA